MSAYTYLIGWRALDVWYYGYRSANKRAPLDDLWTKYFTSSKHVKSFRELHGEPDVIRVHKEFASGKEAKSFEYRFLKKVDAKESERWLNKSLGNGDDFYLREHSTEAREKIRKARLGKPSPLRGKKRPLEVGAKVSASKMGKPSKLKGRPRSPEWIALIKEKNKGQGLGIKRGPHPIETCPHCNKQGGRPAMLRWHFANCKHKETKC